MEQLGALESKVNEITVTATRIIYERVNIYPWVSVSRQLGIVSQVHKPHKLSHTGWAFYYPVKGHNMKYLNLLTLILAGLKLFGLITLSWVLVFVPTFIYLGAVVVVLVFVAFVFKVAGKEMLKAIKDELDD